MQSILEIYETRDLLIAAMRMIGIKDLNNENAVGAFFAFKTNEIIQVHIYYAQIVPANLIDVMRRNIEMMCMITAPVPRRDRTYIPGSPAMIGEVGPELIRVMPGSLVDHVVILPEGQSVWPIERKYIDLSKYGKRDLIIDGRPNPFISEGFVDWDFPNGLWPNKNKTDEV